MKRDIDYSLRHSTVFPTKKIIADLKRIAREENRSLNYVIVQACEQFVASQQTEPTKEK